MRPDVLNRIARLELRARMVVEGFIAGLHRSPYQGFSVEFASHREYVPGDDIRHIDWRIVGRSDRFFIKQYEEETNLRVFVLLDASASMGYPDPPPRDRLSKWDYAATAAASLAYLVIRQQDAAGLMLFDHRIRQEMPPTTHRARLRALIETIERNRPAEGTDVRMLLRDLAERVPHRSLVVLISDLLTDVDEVLAGLDRLRYRGHDVIVLHVLDRDEIEFPFAGQVRFEGLEPPSLEVRVDPQSLRRSYLRALEEYLERLRSGCAAREVDYCLASTAEPLGGVLTAYLARRAHRRRR